MDGTGRLFASLERHLAPELITRVVAFRPDQPRGYDELLAEIPIPAGPFAIVAESFSGPLRVRTCRPMCSMPLTWSCSAGRSRLLGWFRSSSSPSAREGRKDCRAWLGAERDTPFLPLAAPDLQTGNTLFAQNW